VVADRRLGQAQRLGQVADAGLAAGVGGDQGEQAQPGGVGEGLERAGEVGGLLGGQCLPDDRRAAGRRGADVEAHPASMASTLTLVDPCGTLGIDRRRCRLP
jgi:hypothetical protein